MTVTGDEHLIDKLEQPGQLPLPLDSSLPLLVPLDAFGLDQLGSNVDGQATKFVV